MYICMFVASRVKKKNMFIVYVYLGIIRNHLRVLYLFCPLYYIPRGGGAEGAPPKYRGRAQKPPISAIMDNRPVMPIPPVLYTYIYVPCAIYHTLPDG